MAGFSEHKEIAKGITENVFHYELQQLKDVQVWCQKNIDNINVFTHTVGGGRQEYHPAGVI